MPLFRSNKSSGGSKQSRSPSVASSINSNQGAPNESRAADLARPNSISSRQNAAAPAPASGSVDSSSTTLSYLDASVASGSASNRSQGAAPPLPRPPSLFTPSSIATSMHAPSDVIRRGQPTRPSPTPWPVRDDALHPIPSFYPPLDRHCCTFVDDASPSVVAVRISECLRQRSIIADYDEENVTANAMTVDRCQFVIQLHRARGDFAHGGIVVECMRSTGSTMTFHRHCRAILAAAKGTSAGNDDERPARMRRVLEFRQRKRERGNDNRLLQSSTRGSYNTDDAATAAEDALERVRELLRKDRLDCQNIGMESLVGLTTTNSTDTSVVKFVATQLLEEPSLLLKYVASSAAGIVNDGDDEDIIEEESDLTEMELRHAGQMRSMALRTLSNVLDAALKHDLWSKLSSASQIDTKTGRHSHPFLSAKVQKILMGDLQGAQRPASVAASTALASPHEAAIAASCLRHFASESDEDNEGLLERLDAARRVPHAVLQRECSATYAALTEDVRTC